jgi:hypothetical protein
MSAGTLHSTVNREMVDAGIGRLLTASLHQGIADISPTRLDFYENWLTPTGMRDGRIGLAPLGAVLSFIQREAPPADRIIVTHAGVCAADWTYHGVSALRKRLIARLPATLRLRAALRLGRALVVETIARSKVIVHVRDAQGTIDIKSPLFEYLREPSPSPMRHYYAAAYTECLRLCDVDGVVTVDESAPGCRLMLAAGGGATAARPADSG